MDPFPEDTDGYAVIVFAWSDDGWVVADIPNRGWVVPSGRIEPGETVTEAAIRETYEEIGARIEAPIYFGYYKIAISKESFRYMPTFHCTVATYGELPASTESRGVRTILPIDLPNQYWKWDGLVETVFSIAEKLCIAPNSHDLK